MYTLHFETIFGYWPVTAGNASYLSCYLKHIRMLKKKETIREEVAAKRKESREKEMKRQAKRLAEEQAAAEEDGDMSGIPLAPLH